MIKKFIIKNVISPLAAVLLSFIACSALVMLIGKNPLTVFGILFEGTLQSSYGIGQLFFYATPLIFSGLAVSFAFKGGLFNIGCEGQIYMGALFCSWLGWYFGNLPSVVLIPLCILGAIIGGALWGFIPGLLKSKTGSHEVITTIMLNFIALAFTNYVISAHFHVPETIRTPSIGEGAKLSRLDVVFSQLKGSPVNMSFFIAIIMVVFIWYLLWGTRFGYKTRAMGSNKDASRYAGISVSKNIIIVMSVSGALAGMAGINFVMGYKHYFEQGFSGGVGFMGIAVALLGKNHPAGIVVAALLFGSLSFGGLLINSTVPKELVEILQAVVIIFVVIGNTVFSRKFLK